MLVQTFVLPPAGTLSTEMLWRMEDRGLWMDRLVDMPASEIGALLRHPAAGTAIRGAVDSFPALNLEASLQPITRSVLRIQLQIGAAFRWNDRAHGSGLRWHIWVEDSEGQHIYHSESWLLTKAMAREGTHTLAFTIPIHEPLPAQYYVRALSDSWLGAESTLALSFKGLILPERMPPHTELLDLDPLPLSALGNAAFEKLYEGRFTHFNPIQTQARALALLVYKRFAATAALACLCTLVKAVNRGATARTPFPPADCLTATLAYIS